MVGSKVRAIGFACVLLVVACGPEPGSGDGSDEGNGESGDDTNAASDDDAPQVDSTGGGTGDEPTAPECAPVVCGDGIVGLDEPCDDANADDADGCTSECLRTAPSVIATMEHAVQTAAFDADGSVIVVDSSNDPALVRFAPDGAEIWRTTIASGNAMRAVAVRIGAEIVVVGDRSLNDGWEGSTWRFAPDGAPNGRVDDAQARYYVDATLAPNGDTVVLIGSLEIFGASIERRAPDGTPVWTVDVDPDGALGVQDIALTTDEVVLAVGGNSGLGKATISRVTQDDVTTTTLSPPDYPDMFFHAVTPDASGGGIAAADASGQLVLAGIDADGGVAWISTCSASNVATHAIVVSGDRILAHGLRWLPEQNCGDGCSGAFASWVQHFALDGTVIARDAPESLDAAVEYPYETALAVRRDEAGNVFVLGSDQATGFLARFPP